ncbi:MAG: AI-2E family transporter [Anaerolineales bacterium]|jgi:predicted PurR-regulated permease PerM
MTQTKPRLPSPTVEPPPQPPSESPKWSSTAKLVVGLTVVAIVAALLIRFRGIIGPLILAFILAYLLHPLAVRFSEGVKISWRWAVNLIYLLLFIILGGLATLSGLAIVQQLQNLVEFIRRNIDQLPELAANLASTVYRFGPFVVDFGQLFDVQRLTEQILAAVQPLIGRAGSLVSTLATGAIGFLGWALFVLLISYFLLADAGRVTGELVAVDIPGYNQDIRRLSNELAKIWNAFLRGQVIIITLVILTYSIVMAILGMRFALGIAIMAGLARFVPYVGPLITLVVAALVAFFQNSNYFGLEQYQFVILVVVVTIVIDQIFDNVVTPRFLGETLGIHPASVLVAAIIAANLIGLIGLVLAAPVLATLHLVGRYVWRKMLDLDPWPDDEGARFEEDMPWTQVVRRVRDWLRKRREHA